jgi:mRNA interferase MazF
VRRGDVYDVRLDPIEGSEAAGRRPAIVVSRDALNTASPVVLVVPCASFRVGRRVYPSQVLLRAGQGGLAVDSVAQAEQVRAVSKARLVRHRGSLSTAAMTAVSTALRITLDLGN